MRLALLALVVPFSLSAQIRASELAEMSQVIDGTKLTVEYSRPRARGREKLFGKGDMRTGDIWTPGANYASTLEVSKDIKLNQVVVPKGKYSMWMVLGRPDAWTLMLDPKAHRFHEDRPDSTKIALRIPVKVETVPGMTDVLTFSMPELRMNGGTLAFDWEHAHVAMDVEVQPSLVMTLSANDAAPYLGEYVWQDMDSTGKVVRTTKFTVTHENETLKGQWTPDDPYFKKFALVRIAPDWFAPGVYDKGGQIYEVLRPDLTIEFTRANGVAASLVMRDDADHVVSTATRKP
jgi:Protein of unknown function (DUF2911)